MLRGVNGAGGGEGGVAGFASPLPAGGSAEVASCTMEGGEEGEGAGRRRRAGLLSLGPRRQ